MKKPVVHLICNAHLDPVWQWRWEEGAAEAITTFGIAARLLREFPDFVFNHNEAILYRWVREYDPSLFGEIQQVSGGRAMVHYRWLGSAARCEHARDAKPSSGISPKGGTFSLSILASSRSSRTISIRSGTAGDFLRSS